MSWVKKGINHLVLLAIGLIWVYPFLWMISASFKSQNEFFNNRLGLIPQAPTLDNIKRIWVKANFGSYFLNTVVVTCFAVVLVLIITMLAGYAMGRYKFVGRNLMMGIFVGSIAIPLVSTIIPTYEVVKGMHLTGTKTGLVLAQAGGAHVIFLMLFTSFFASIPMELEEADEMVRSALCEITNISCGKASIELAEKGVNCDIKTPVILDNSLSETEINGMFIDTGSGGLEVMVFVDEMA